MMLQSRLLRYLMWSILCVTYAKVTEEDEAMLSDSEADYDAYDNLSERAQNKLMSPNFRFFRWYSTFMLLTLLIFVFYLPLRVAFFPRERCVR